MNFLALSPLWERMHRAGVLTSRGGPGEGVCFGYHLAGQLAYEGFYGE
jgi:hypothetical protein